MRILCTYPLSLILICLLAFLLRGVAAFGVQKFIDHRPARFDLIEGDASGYWQLAQKIAHGQPFEIYQPPRQVHRMPGFPAILAVSMSLFGEDPLPARLLLAAIGSATCGMTFLLTRALFNDPIANIAGYWAAFSPPLIGFSVVFLSETSFALFVLINLWLVIGWWKATTQTQRITYATLTGFSAALATYQRPSWYPFLAIIALFFVYQSKEKILTRKFASHTLAPIALMLLAFQISMSPWIIRNKIVTNHFVMTTLWMGPSLYDGLNPTATGDSNMTFFDQDNLMSHMSEYDVDQHYKHAGWQYAWQHPAHATQLAIVKLYRYFKPWPNARQFGGTAPAVVIAVHAVPLLLLATLGVFYLASPPEYSSRAGDRSLVVLITLMPILFFAAIHMIFVSSLRYRLPLEYPLLALSSYALYSTLKARRSSEQIPVSATQS